MPQPQNSARRLAVATCVVGLCVGVASVATALAGGLAGELPGSAPTAAEILGNLPRALADCVVAGVGEELLFRGLLFVMLVAALAKRPHAVMTAAVTQAVIFGMLHLLGGPAADAGTGAVVLQAAAKAASGCGFGLVMAAIFVRTRNLLWPIIIHMVYDLLSLAPVEALTGPTTTYLTGTFANSVILVATAIAFGILAAVAVSVLDKTPANAVPNPFSS